MPSSFATFLLPLSEPTPRLRFLLRQYGQLNAFEVDSLS